MLTYNVYMVGNCIPKVAFVISSPISRFKETCFLKDAEIKDLYSYFIYYIIITFAFFVNSQVYYFR